MDDFLRSWMASGRGQSPKDYRKTYEELQKNKALYKQGQATRVITGYSTRPVGPDGSKKTPTYAYIPKQQPAAAPAPPPAPAPAPAPAPTKYTPKALPTPNAPKPVALDTSAYDAQIKKLNASLGDLQNQLKSNSSAYAKTIADQQNKYGQQTAQYDQMFANQQTMFDKKYVGQQQSFDKQLLGAKNSFDQAMSNQVKKFNTTMEQAQIGYANNLKSQQEAQAKILADQTTKYDNNMSSLKNSLAETMSNKSQPILGVKSSAAGAQSSAQKRQGIKGTFGRSGLRIKGIKDKSLNI